MLGCAEVVCGGAGWVVVVVLGSGWELAGKCWELCLYVLPCRYVHYHVTMRVIIQLKIYFTSI